MEAFIEFGYQQEMLKWGSSTLQIFTVLESQLYQEPILRIYVANFE